MIRNNVSTLRSHAIVYQAAFSEQWKISTRAASNWSNFFASIPFVVLLAWIANQSERDEVFTFVLFGAFLRVIWTHGVTRIGWSLDNELLQGTLAANLISRSPLQLILLGKATAIIATNLLPGILASALVLVIAREHVEVNNLPLFGLAAAAAVVSVASLCFIFAPLFILTGRQSGFFNPVIPLGILCSGFFFPISLLPAPLQAIGLIIPTSWATSAAVGALSGKTSTIDVLLEVSIAAGIASCYLMLSAFLVSAVVRRVRVTGILAAH